MSYQPDRRDPLTAERLREVLDYDASTGVFTRRLCVGQRTRVGELAGTDNGAGYLQCRVNGRLHKCHRLAWLHVHGHWPKFDIDHINGSRTDNRISNLRDAPTYVNVQNQRRAPSNNDSGLLGVHAYCWKGYPYSALITVHGKRVWLGKFTTAQAAHEAYINAKRERHEGCTI